MAVVNLGKVSRRESPLSGVSEGLAAGMEMKLSRETLAQRERERKTREKANESAMSSALASQQLRKREQDLKNVRKTHDQFSLWWNDMDAQKKTIAKSSDQYKEMQKFFKGFSNLVPGLVSDNGDIVAVSTKDIFKKKLEDRTAQAVLNISQGKGTKEDVRLAKMTESTKDQTAEVLANAAKKLKGDEAGDPQTFMQKVKEVLGTARKFYGDAAGALGAKHGANRASEMLAPQQPNQVQVTQPQAPVKSNAMGADSNNDPLGILGR